MMAQHRSLLAHGEDSFVFWGRGRSPEDSREMRFSTAPEVCLDAFMTRVDDRAGFHSAAPTKRLLKRLDAIRPDVVHLHNLHGYYLNVRMLFEWLLSSKCEVIWTLHDCWAFTGHCVHFVYADCDEWKTGCCGKCPQLSTYPATFGRGACRENYENTRRAFTLLPPSRQSLVVPSRWLERLVCKSFLESYPIEVKNNPIDVDSFKPTQSDFRERFGIGERFMILGVASPWSPQKGLNVFARLASELDDREFAVVLVGVTKGDCSRLPKQAIGVGYVGSKAELAGIYTSADVYLQPSEEETYGLTVAEAQACGTEVVVARGSACEEIGDPRLTTAVPCDYASIKHALLALARSRSEARIR